jgi:hypothetical protein
MKPLACAAVLAVLACAFTLPARSQTLVVGTCKAPKRVLNTYTTIQAAVNAAPRNATVLVCPGTYAEQITITTPLTLEGISAPPLPNPTIAGPADGLPGNSPVLSVATHGSPGLVNIQGLVFTDPICAGSDSSGVSAIEYVSTSGAVTGTVIQGFGDPGCGGFGIVVENDDAWPVNVELANNVIRGMEPYGTAIEVTSGPSSSRLNAQIRDNLVSAPVALKSSTNGDGVSAVGNSFQGTDTGLNTVVLNDAAVIDHNDIAITNASPQEQPSAIVANGNGATITSNTITANGCCVVGISVVGGHVRASSNKITGNVVSGEAHANSVGIATASASADIEWNIVDDFTYGIDMYCEAATVHSNTILDSTTGIVDVPKTATPVNNFVNVTTPQISCP